jgi:hypothetical protein
MSLLAMAMTVLGHEVLRRDSLDARGLARSVRAPRGAQYARRGCCSLLHGATGSSR